MTWVFMMLSAVAWADQITGRDEFGRECALDTDRFAVLIEGEWFDRPEHHHWYPETAKGPVKSPGAGVFTAVVKSRTDGVEAEVQISFHAGRKPRDFSLWLASATGYVHTCTFP